jgi:photosystem II stability/assembly factor-like uncharacterized protein
MKLLTFRYIWVVIFFCLSGCHKLNPGGPAAAPTNVKVVSGDTIATVTWDMVSGVEYFIYWDTGSGVTPDGCGASPTCKATIQASSPYVISGLTDGTTYSVTINGRTQGGRGGPGSPAISFVPGYAGTNWTSGVAGGNALNGITYSNIIYDVSGNNLGSGYVAAGASGALYYGIVDSSNNLNWTPITNSPLPSTTLNALSNSGATFLAVGDTGTIMYSTNYTETWTTFTGTTTPYNLYAISAYNGFFAATGQHGTILTSDSSGTTTWTAQTSGTTNDLNGIAFGNQYVVVGNSGTLLTSSNAVNWTANSSIASTFPAINLKSVTYCGVTPPTGVSAGTTIYPYVAVGSSGTVLTSIDGGTTWTSQVLPNANATITGVTCGHQFVAVDTSGNIFTSFDGLSWTGPVQTASGSLNAIAHGAYDYTAVGASGLTFHSM